MKTQPGITMRSRFLTMFAVCACLLAVTVLAGCFKDPSEPRDMPRNQDAEHKARWSTDAEKAARAKKADDAIAGTVMKSVDRPEGTPVEVWKAGNDGGIEGMGGTPPLVHQEGKYFITEIRNYHSDGSGANMGPAGKISLKAEDGTVYGPWQAELVSDVYWVVQPDQELPGGNYTLIDSNPSTWAQNSGSGGQGMGYAMGIPVK